MRLLQEQLAVHAVESLHGCIFGNCSCIALPPASMQSTACSAETPQRRNLMCEEYTSVCLQAFHLNMFAVNIVHVAKYPITIDGIPYA